ncbi:hypothetical protein TWF102_000100 [Orbilia oligospora]|uniref:Peptidase A1 domain-containing protein n=2 Tax=Orbilia oligospora TaxID=2813651 RepID=A0A7C8NYH6_ORBOL|nr:hypothetical protein TWF706_004676 [Orbilia oligospora]KAF3113439.1 hypothetical protein TWF102_000100 [Orbilia oligospora]KAF3115193.1 hypothetical protein TWF103_011455 [Orbilia oligospora]
MQNDTMGWKTRLLTLILDVQILIGAVIAELDVQVVRQNATGKGVVVFSNITLQPYGGSSYGFLVEAPIGTPPQTVTLRLTGEWINWIPSYFKSTLSVPPNCSIISCTVYDVEKYGVYNGSMSSTYREPGPPIQQNFSTLRGGWITYDRLSMGDLRLSSLPFIAAEVSNEFPQLGLGMRYVDWLNSNRGDENLGLLQAVFKEGLIEVEGLGVYLGAYDENSSQITLGGIDIAKYEAPMTVFTPQHIDGGSIIFEKVSVVYLTEDSSLNYVIQNRNIGDAIVYFLIGDPDIRVPGYLRSPILQSLEAYELIERNSNDSVWYMDCERIQYRQISLKFESQGMSITLTTKDLVGKVELKAGDWWFNSSVPYPKKEACRIFVSPSESYRDATNDDIKEGSIFLGHPFLRLAYMWFDYQNGQIGLAKAKRGVGISNITKIQEDGIIATVGRSGAIVFGDSASSQPNVKVIVGSAIGGIMIVGAIGSLVFWFVLRKQKTPEIPPVPTTELELEGQAKFEMPAKHGNCEVVGSGGYPNELPEEDQQEYHQELPASHAFPAELPGSTVLRSGRNSRDSSSSRDSNV